MEPFLSYVRFRIFSTISTLSFFIHIIQHMCDKKKREKLYSLRHEMSRTTLTRISLIIQIREAFLIGLLSYQQTYNPRVPSQQFSPKIP